MNKYVLIIFIFISSLGYSSYKDMYNELSIKYAYAPFYFPGSYYNLGETYIGQLSSLYYKQSILSVMGFIIYDTLSIPFVKNGSVGYENYLHIGLYFEPTRFSTNSPFSYIAAICYLRANSYNAEYNYFSFIFKIEFDIVENIIIFGSDIIFITKPSFFYIEPNITYQIKENIGIAFVYNLSFYLISYPGTGYGVVIGNSDIIGQHAFGIILKYRYGEKPLIK